MKLLLCSWGPWRNPELESTFLDLISKPINENKLLILATDTTSDWPVRHQNIARTWYKQKGFQEGNIRVCNLKTDQIPSLDGIDVLHMWGGNPFHYMKLIREMGLMPRIRDFISRGGVYVGGSAGSMIMCPNIDVSLTDEVNDVGLEDVSGFGYVDFNIVMHWDTRSDDLHTAFLVYSWEKGRKIVTLTDQQAVLVLDDGFKIISRKGFDV